MSLFPANPSEAQLKKFSKYNQLARNIGLLYLALSIVFILYRENLGVSVAQYTSSNWNSGLNEQQQVAKLRELNITMSPADMTNVMKYCVNEGEQAYPRQKVITYCQGFMPKYYQKAIQVTIDKCLGASDILEFHDSKMNSYLAKCMSVTYYVDDKTKQQLISKMSKDKALWERSREAAQY